MCRSWILTTISNVWSLTSQNGTAYMKRGHKGQGWGREVSKAKGEARLILFRYIVIYSIVTCRSLALKSWSILSIAALFLLAETLGSPQKVSSITEGSKSNFPATKYIVWITQWCISTDIFISLGTPSLRGILFKLHACVSLQNFSI